MTIIINVIGQQMAVKGHKVPLAPHSENFIKLTFLLPSEWENFKTFAQFRQSNNSPINVYLDESNSVYVPREIKAGNFTVMLYGAGESIIGTTNCLIFDMVDNCFSTNAIETDLTPTLYQQLLNEFKGYLASTKADAESATASENAAKGYATAANASAQSAATSADNATAAEKLAKDSATKANTSAELASNYANKSEESAKAALASQQAASESQKAARDFAKAASNSELAAGKSATTASGHADTAKSYATQAQTALSSAEEARKSASESAVAANASATEAKKSEDAVKANADQVAADKKATAASQSAAAASAKSASDSASDAASSATAAATSETAAEQSAAAAKASEDAAKSSQIAAADSANAIQESAEQITQNKTDIATETARAKSAEESNASSITKNTKDIDLLWKLNKGISYSFDTDETTAYQKIIPEAAKATNAQKIGGRSLVWNQKFDVNDYADIFKQDILSFKKTESINAGNIYLFKVTATINPAMDITKDRAQANVFIGHKGGNSNYPINLSIISGSQTKAILFKADYSAKGGLSNTNGYFWLYMWNCYVSSAELFDLTKMFGSGNEPTIEEFEAMFPNDYYPYNAGEIISANVDTINLQGANLCPVGDSRYKLQFTNNTYHNLTYEINKDRSIHIKGTINNTSDSNIYVNFQGINFNQKTKINLAPGTYTASPNLVIGLDENKSGTFTLNKWTKIYGFYIYWSIQPGKTRKVDETFYFMLNRGSKALAYVPYKEKPIDIAIPDAVKALDGYGWGVSNDIYNYVDYENKKYHKRVGRVDLGSLSYDIDGNEIYNRFTSNPIPGLKDITTNISQHIICPKYETLINSDFSNKDKIIYNIGNRIAVHDKAYNNTADFKSAVSGVYAYYELAEEEVTDISDILTDNYLMTDQIEPGGTITFHQSGTDSGYLLPIPSTVESVISIAEKGSAT